MKIKSRTQIIWVCLIRSSMGKPKILNNLSCILLRITSKKMRWKLQICPQPQTQIHQLVTYTVSFPARCYKERTCPSRGNTMSFRSSTSNSRTWTSARLKVPQCNNRKRWATTLKCTRAINNSSLEARTLTTFNSLTTTTSSTPRCKWWEKLSTNKEFKLSSMMGNNLWLPAKLIWTCRCYLIRLS